MSKKRTLPTGMRKSAEQRTDTSVAAIFAHLNQLEAEILKGKGSVEPLNVRNVSVGAGLNARFLYGPLHRDRKNNQPSTKSLVENKIATLNLMINSQPNERGISPEIDTVGQLRDEVAYWKDRYERLARHANLWFARERDQQKIIRDLRKQESSANSS